VITYIVKNDETSTTIEITSNKSNISYHNLIDEIVNATNNYNVYISLKSIHNKGLGKLINQLDLNRQPLKSKLGKIRMLMNKYNDGYLLFNDNLNHQSKIADDNKIIIVEW
jgi:hypothetical protein